MVFNNGSGSNSDAASVGSGTSSLSSDLRGNWNVGLVNSSLKKYLTAETFGFKVNASGASFKKKQTWLLEPYGDNTDAIALRSHLDKYLAVDQYGNVTCESDEKDESSKFDIIISPSDSKGRWALRHVLRGYYLGASADKLICTAKSAGDAELWWVVLVARPQAVLKTRSSNVTRDELFSLEDSVPQATFMSLMNGRYVSVKQGVDVTANQDEVSDHETFQLEFDLATKRWYLRTMGDRYWTLESGGGIQAGATKKSSNALFELAWQADCSVAFRANNGKYVATKKSGHLFANSEVVDDASKFYFHLANRPVLVLKCDQGFVGFKSANTPKMECNKAQYETIIVEKGPKGQVFFKGQNNCYWQLTGDGVTVDADSPEGLYLELREPSKIAIKTPNNTYLNADKNGVFKASSAETPTLWEF
ncbi:protein singed-like isoform X2 [Artemia franciscana]|uniref:protein singed-like isoform X2 n=1 Tax=Artemia franciscana TaxID=6661 RepID=UPI0032DBB29F